jgi:hypothetical protein
MHVEIELQMKLQASIGLEKPREFKLKGRK